MKSKLLSLSLATSIIASSSFGYDLKSPLEALPAHTIAAIEVDNSTEIQKAFSTNTKLGQLLLSPERIAGYKNYIEELTEEEDELQNTLQKLEDVGLSLDDIYSMISSKLGLAVTLLKGANGEPYPIIYIWAEMEDGVAEKAFDTLLETSGSSEDFEREDQELSGILTTRIRDNKNGSSAVLARLENRLIFMIGFPTAGSDREQGAYYEEKEIEELGTFISAQLGEGGEFLENFYATSGVAAHIPQNTPTLQVLGDVSKLILLAPQKNIPIFHALKLTDLTKIGFWTSFDDKLQTANFFLGSPNPREGAPAILDQEPIQFETPSWIPQAATVYSVTSFDIDKIYNIGLEVAANLVPQEMINQQIGEIEEQLQNALQTDLASLLASFGKRIYTIDFPINFIDHPTSQDGSTIPQESKAIITEFENTEILARALAMAAPFANQQQPGVPGMEIFEEMGFNGIRISIAGVESTFSYGKNKFVVTQGQGTASRVFSLLNNPPEGSDALVNNEVFRNAVDQYSSEKGLSFTYADGDKLLSNLIPIVTWAFQQGTKSVAGDDMQDIEKFLALFPEEEEFKETLGAIITRMYTSEDGLNGNTFYEYK